jgi:S-disulfanyl-L-cysteine oxidoreductase SoxD
VSFVLVGSIMRAIDTPALTHPQPDHPDEVLFRITKLGVAKSANLKDYDSAMPAYEGVLTDAQIVAALSYIKSQWPPEIRQRHDQLNEAAKKKPG